MITSIYLTMCGLALLTIVSVLWDCERMRRRAERNLSHPFFVELTNV